MNINWPKFGAAVTSLITILAVSPYELGKIGEVIPPAWKPYLVAGGALATLVLRATASVQKSPITEDKKEITNEQQIKA